MGTSESVQHTHLVLEKLTDVHSDLLTMQGARRGYIITGEKRFLEPFREARPKVSRDVAALRALTADNPRRRPGPGALPENPERSLRENRLTGSRILFGFPPLSLGSQARLLSG